MVQAYPEPVALVEQCRAPSTPEELAPARAPGQNLVQGLAWDLVPELAEVLAPETSAPQGSAAALELERGLAEVAFPAWPAESGNLKKRNCTACSGSSASSERHSQRKILTWTHSHGG